VTTFGSAWEPGSPAALELVVAGAAVEGVGAEAAEELVGPGAAEQAVGAAGALEEVRAAVARDRVGAGGADDALVGVRVAPAALRVGADRARLLRLDTDEEVGARAARGLRRGVDPARGQQPAPHARDVRDVAGIAAGDLQEPVDERGRRSPPVASAAGSAGSATAAGAGGGGSTPGSGGTSSSGRARRVARRPGRERERHLHGLATRRGGQHDDLAAAGGVGLAAGGGVEDVSPVAADHTILAGPEKITSSPGPASTASSPPKP
jgi:hypothetical protein